MTRLFRRLRARFYRWRLYAAHPELKSLMDEIEEKRRSHRPTRRLVEAQQHVMLRALREGR
jgi:hypothetical protein